MEKERALRERLAGFEAVWRRVTAAKTQSAPPRGVKLMPRRKAVKSRML